MGRSIPVLLALLFALSSPAIAVSAPTAPDAGTAGSVAGPPAAIQSAPNNSTSMLTLGGNGTVESASVTPSLSLGTALDARHAGLQGEFDVSLLEERLSDVDSPDRKREIIFQFTYRIEDRIEALRQQDERARRAYVNGSISANEYVQRLATIDAKADHVRTVLDRVRSIARSTPQMSLETRYWSLRFQLGAVTGPVRDKVLSIAAGRAPADRIYVASTESSVVLSMIDDGTLVREITRLDNYAPDGDRELTFQESQRRVSELYPTISSVGSSGGSSSRGTNVGISQFTYTNAGEYGKVTIYFDGRSGKVFKEVRRQRVSLMKTRTVRNTKGGLTVTANYTFATGPMHVRLTDTDSGIPVNGSVMVNGQRVANTGSTGEIWLIAPRGRVTVSASHENATVNVSARPDDRSLSEA